MGASALLSEPVADRYAAGMASRELLGVRALRDQLGRQVTKAQGDDAVHTVVLVEGHKRGVLVPLPWRHKAGAALGEPLVLTQVPLIAVSELRKQLGQQIGKHIIAGRHGGPAAVLVPWDWYVRASTELGEQVAL